MVRSAIPEQTDKMKLKSLLMIGAVLLCLGTAIAAKPRKSIDRRADAAKAIQLAEAGTTMMSNNLLGAALMLNQADTLNGSDPKIKLAINNFFILLMPEGNPTYYEQLELLENTPDASRAYYYAMTEAIPVNDGELDSLEYFNMAVRAHRRFPEDGYFAEKLLSRGVTYLYNKRFKDTGDGETTDTLQLSDKDVAFADTLLSWGNSMEQLNGYSLDIDRSRAAILRILDRNDDLLKLAGILAERDSTDIDLLDLRTSLAYTLGDSLQVYELGIKRFELNPDGEHVYSLYNAMPNDTMKVKLADAVITKATDTDIDPETRLELLRALAEAYYNNVGEIVGTVELLDKISATVEEICAEDPLEKLTYLRGTALTFNSHWLSTYGYRHWVNAVNKVSDKDGELEGVAEALVPLVENKNEFEKALIALINYYEENESIYTLDAKIALAQYYYNSDLYQKALDILLPITLADLQEDYRKAKEADTTSTEEDKTEDTSNNIDEDDNNQIERFIAIQTLISECQMNLGRVDDALATLNHVITIDPTNAGALNNLAYYMCENGRDLTIALTLAERSLSLEPDNLNTIDTRAWIFFKKGNIEGAVNDMKKFFETLNVDFEALIDSENEKTMTQVLEEANIKLDAVVPYLGHLLRILSQKEDVSEATLQRIVDFISENAPDNEDLAIYLKTNGH